MILIFVGSFPMLSHTSEAKDYFKTIPLEKSDSGQEFSNNQAFKDENKAERYDLEPSNSHQLIATVSSLLAYTDHLPIDINMDADFGPSGYNFTGYGNETHPYLIEGYNITSSTGNLIDISGTTVNFCVQNNWLNGIDKNSYGIYLSNVINGTIDTNQVLNCHSGIRIFSSSNTTVKNNNVSLNDQYGIFLLQSGNISILENSVYNNPNTGIYLYGSENSTIMHNHAFINGAGIFLSYLSNNNSVLNNYLYNNTGRGIRVYDSHDSTIKNNDIRASGIGIIFESSSNATIFNNSFFSDLINGINLDSTSNDTIVSWNSFQEGASSNAYDDGNRNNFTYNYWDIWVSPDVDYNGLVDHPYPINGIAANTDPFPRTHPYLFHDPIYINDNTDFPTEGFTGAGTSEDPYVLEDYFIINSTQNLIHISDTTAHFEIKNCLFTTKTGSYSGIYFWNVKNGKVADNTIHHCFDGIKLDSSCENNTLIGNTLYNNSYYAIYISQSSRTCIVSNTILNQSDDGIVLGNAHDNTLLSNTITHTRYGIAFSNDCTGNLLSDNNISHNSGYGIYIYNSDANIFSSNSVENNLEHGIYLQSSSYNNLSLNKINRNFNSGIFMSGSENTLTLNKITNHSGGGNFGIYVGPGSTSNEISNNTLEDNWYGIYIENTAHNNTVFDNTLDNVYSLYLRTSAGFNHIFSNNFLSTVIDNNGTNIFYYNGRGNYWGSAYTGSDGNGDGVGDTPHTFTDNQDPFPLMYPREWYTIHNLIQPNLLFPNGGETLSGSITIQWDAAIDILGHTVTYSVFYSDDGGANWVPLVTNLPSTSHNWNTTTLADHSNYMIKVIATCSEGLSVEDTSDGTFSISNPIITTTSESTTSPISSISSTTIAELNTSSSGWLATIFVLSVISVCFTIKRRRRI